MSKDLNPGGLTPRDHILNPYTNVPLLEIATVTRQHGYYYGPKFVDEDTRTMGKLSNRTQDMQCRGECWDLDPGSRPGKHTRSPTALQCQGSQLLLVL